MRRARSARLASGSGVDSTPFLLSAEKTTMADRTTRVIHNHPKHMWFSIGHAETVADRYPQMPSRGCP